MQLVGMRVLESADTPAHVEKLKTNPAFEKSLHGWKPATESPPRVEGVAGSTLTALAMVEGISRRMGGRSGSLRFPEALRLEEVSELFPGAVGFDSEPNREGWFRVLGAEKKTEGFVVRTSPVADGVFGYAGPTESLVAVGIDGETVLRIRIRRSYDTEEYVDRVREDSDYLRSLARWKVNQWSGLNFESEKIEGVAGATETSYAVAEAVKKRFSVVPSAVSGGAPALMRSSTVAMAVFLLGAVGLSFSSLRGRMWIRRGWQLVLIGGLGWWLGQLLSIGVLAGWARYGIPLQQSGALVGLAIVALIVPWASGRQVYCHQICPHGALQEWLGRVPVPKLRPGPRWEKALRAFPGLLLAGMFLAILRVPGFAAAQWEPFDFWGVGFAAWIPAILACAGLALSCFVPMAHCRYACVTGELLRFVRSDSSGKKFGMRDFCVAGCLLLGAALQLGSSGAQSDMAPVAEVRGVGFGTTWCVKARGNAPGLLGLRASLAAEVARIEDTLSHWRPGSATSRFNANRSADNQTVPDELAVLVGFARRLSVATSGAYDITVAPLVNQWGFGPSGIPKHTPSDEEIASTLSRVGWQKLALGEGSNQLRKSHPSLELDLGSILQGYTVDRLHDILRAAGLSEFLVEVGGELRASGTWRVAVENPCEPGRPVCVMDLEDSALATSGMGRSRSKEAARSHIISAQTGRPVRCDVSQLSIRAATCLEADGWATALFASGWSRAREIADSEGFAVWAVRDDGSLLKSDRAGRGQ
jgi:thiamine biosynthesis lipoprotein ApbE